MKGTCLDLLVVIAVALLAIGPVLYLGFPEGHSTGLDLHWAKEFSAQFWAGNLYPRWLGASFHGFGAPTFFFYPPLPFWWSSLLLPLFGGEIAPWQSLGTAAAAIALLSGAGCYLWLHEAVASRFASIIGALLYLLAPYQFAINFHVRTAYAEYFGAAVLPFVFLAAIRAARGSNLAILGLAAAYASLIMAHLPTTLMVSIFPGLIPFFIASRPKIPLACTRVWLGMILGIGLSAMYLVPALALQQLVDADSWWKGYYRFDRWFLFNDEESPHPIMVALCEIVYLGTVGAAVLVLAAMAATKYFRDLGSQRARTALLSTLMIVVAALMCLRWSRPVWDNLVELQKIQFPWRFMGPLEFATATLIAHCVAHHAGLVSAWRRPQLVLWALPVFALLLFTWVATSPTLQVDRSLANHFTKAAIAGVEAPEYGTSFAPQLATEPEIRDNEKNYPALLSWGREVKMLDGSARVSVEVWDPPGRIVVLIGETDGARLVLPHFYFPTWNAAMIQPDGEQVALQARPSDEFGLIELMAPPGGNYRLVVTGRRLPIEQVGFLISAVALVAFIFLGARFARVGSSENDLGPHS